MVLETKHNQNSGYQDGTGPDKAKGTGREQRSWSQFLIDCLKCHKMTTLACSDFV